MQDLNAEIISPLHGIAWSSKKEKFVYDSQMNT